MTPTVGFARMQRCVSDTTFVSRVRCTKLDRAGLRVQGLGLAMPPGRKSVSVASGLKGMYEERVHENPVGLPGKEPKS